MISKTPIPEQKSDEKGRVVDRTEESRRSKLTFFGVCPRPGFGQLEKSEDGSVCAMVTLNPALEWPENHKLSQEIIIVVDRSASMAGKRIAQVIRAVQSI